MLFEYEDKFLTDGIDESSLENIEAQQYDFVLNKLSVSDKFYIEKLTKCRVYMQLARLQLESDGMKAKYNIYNSEYKHFLELAKPSEFNSITTLQLARG